MLPAEAPRERRRPLVAVRALGAAAAPGRGRRRAARRPPAASRVAAGLVAALVAAVAAGCGDGDGGSPGGGAAGGAGGGETVLTITLDRDGEGGRAPEEATVECDGRGADAVCAALAGVGADDLAPVPAATPCTEIYGGPDEATVAGTLGGEPVDETLTRANGCEIERFDHLVPALRELFPGYVPGEALAPAT